MSEQREKILRYYKASGDGELAGQLLDTAEAVLRSRKYKASEFLDPAAGSIAETICAHYNSLTLQAEGGYSGAERVKAIFVHEDFMGTPDTGIAAIAVKWDERFYTLTHRDVLGAVLGLGIKREVLGDIIMCGHGCQILLEKALRDFILRELHSIGAASVTAEEISLAEIMPREEKVKEIKTTVAALRLDVVAAAGFGTSRSRMSEEIELGKLKVNWQDSKSSSKNVKAGDIISMRGRGRVEVCEVLGQTKKGRISILLKRFM